MPGLDELQQVRAKKAEIKRQIVLAKTLKEAPTLYWGLQYHTDTKGHPLEFGDVPYLVELYRHIHEWHSFVAIKAAQVGLTELLFLNNLREAAEGLSVFYVFPKYELRNRFVSNRVLRVLRRVPFYRDKVKEAASLGGTERMSLIHFGKGGLAFVGSNVEDEFLEIPVDSATIDELDRCHQQNLLLVPDRLKRSKQKYMRRISNPTVEGYGIDELYNESSKGRWFVKCNHCGHWFSPDFFAHVILQTGPHSYKPRDPEYVKGDSLEIGLMCDKCGKSVDRLAIGEWVFEYPKIPLVGVRLNQIISPRTTLLDLFREWQKAIGNKIKEQRFYNMVLGLAFSSKGSKIFAWELDKCQRDYAMPTVPTQHGMKVMGIDVGNPIYYIVRERVTENGVQSLRLVGGGTAMDFDVLAKKIRDWSPRLVVIDADPEGHQVSRLKKVFGNVWSCRFQPNLVEPNKNKEDRHVTVDRTSLLDVIPAAIEAGTFLLPRMDGSYFLDGDYYKHMQASTRIYDENELHPEKSRFVWSEGSQPDHYFLAEGYCLLADAMLPDSSLVLGYYVRQVQQAEKDGGITVPLSNQSHSDVIRYMKEVEEMDVSEEAKGRMLEGVSQTTVMATKSREFNGGMPVGRSQEEIEAEQDRAIFSMVKPEDEEVDAEVIGRATGLGAARVGMRLLKLGWVKIATARFRRPEA